MKGKNTCSLAGWRVERPGHLMWRPVATNLGDGNFCKVRYLVFARAVR